MEHITNNEIPIIEQVPEKQGYYEIYDDGRKIWHTDPNPFSMKFKSKEQIDKDRPKFPPLTHDDYTLMLTKIELSTQPKYMAKPDKETGVIPQEEVLNITFEVVSHKDGKEAYDEDGQPAKDRKIFFTGRPESMGFKTDGTPSKTRCLLAYMTGQSVEGELEIESWEALLGKTIFAEIVKHTTQKGELRNKIARFIAPRQERTQPKAEAPKPKAEDPKKKQPVKKK